MKRIECKVFSFRENDKIPIKEKGFQLLSLLKQFARAMKEALEMSVFYTKWETSDPELWRHLKYCVKSLNLKQKSNPHISRLIWRMRKFFR